MTWKKRIISIVLCLCALLCAASVRADAAEHSHPICGASHKDIGDHTGTCDNVTWTAWDGTDTIGNDFFKDSNTKYLYLSRDVEMSDKWTDTIVPEGKALYLCLNGHSLTRKASGYTINVYGTLVLCDCNGSGQGKGAISHGKEEDGSFCGTEGIYVIDNAIFTMYGGTICNNDGRGVLVSGGTFTMYGGEISHNTCITESAGGGGGVWVKDDGSNIGNFTMYGGTICKNTYKGIGNCGGGGVYASGTGDFIIQGGEITNNQCSYNDTNTSNGASGGGLYISGKPRELKIENCTISNNTCDGEGGGIFINCANVTGAITGCTISGNEAGGKGGGFASQYCTLTIGNCNITNNRTAGKGGAMAVGSWGEDSKITLSGSMNFSGNAQGCTAGKDGKLTGGTENDVHLNTSSVYLRLADDFSKTSTDPIVVTTASEPNNRSTVKIAEGSASAAKATDFTYGNDSTIGIIAKTNNGKVELLACKHNYSTKKDTTNHWQECSICKDIKGVTAHSGGEASCTKKAVCRVCNQPYGKLAAHVYDTTKWVKIDNDHHGHKCNNCNAIDTTSKAPHDWNSGAVTTPATCTTAGEKTFTCTACSATKTEPVPATGHTEVTDAAVEATCTEPGKTEGKHCSVCNAVLVAQKVIPAKGHTEVIDAAVEATCTEPGKTEGKHCSVCNTVLVEQTAIPASGHTEVIDAAVEATCTEPGKTEGKHCSVCNAVLVAQKVVPAKGHTEVIDAAVEATCTEPGKTEGKHCSVCNTVLVEQTAIPASGHTEVIDAAVEATCTEPGKTEGKHCSVCNAVLVAQKVVPAKGHTEVIDAAVEATCTEPGKTEGKHCSVCNAALVAQQTVPVKAHDWGTQWISNDSDEDHHWHKCKNCNAIDASTKAPHSWDNVEVTTPATCTAAGVKTFTCTACSATKTEPVPATGHTPGAAVRENKVAATCTTAGSYDEVVYCTACRNELSRTQKTIDKLAHDYDTTKWVKADENHHGHKCKNCDAITDLTAHVPGAAATETTPQLCTECGYVIAPATHPVHTWVFVAETPATCNAVGEKEHYKCTCGRTSFKNGDTYAINEDASVLTIEKNSANHTGNIGEQWHSDSANHWQEYTCCHARANEAAHSGGAATCTAQAVCQVCGKAYGPLAAHAWQPATCTAPKTCTACHVTDGAALAHDWGAWKVTTPATKDAPGVETRTCTHNSAHTETRSIPKLSTAVYTVSEDTKIAQIEAKVDGLDKILELNENKALVNDGKSVGVSLTVKNTASSGVSEKIKEKLAGSNLVGLRLELTVEKTVTENGAVVERENIPDTGVLLRTTITLPAELQGKSGYVVYRLHDGNVHVLTETANENGEFISVSADKTQITICARLYSEYVIAYQTGGSSGGGYHPVNPTPVKATSANTGDAGVLLYGVTAALSLTGTAWLGAKSRKH